MDINVLVTNATFYPFIVSLVLTLLFAQILQHMEKERKILERLLYKIFCVMKPHPMGRTRRSLCMLLGSGMLSV